MRASVTLDDDLMRQAQEYTGITEPTAILREALRALIQREAGRRINALAGSMPEIEDIWRQRMDDL